MPQNPPISLSFDFGPQNPCLGPILVILVTGVTFSIGSHPVHDRGTPEPNRTHTHTSEQLVTPIDEILKINSITNITNQNFYGIL